MPPELADSWIALCASDSQFGAVLEAIDGVEAMVDSSELPTLPGGLVGLVEAGADDGSAELADELDEDETGKPEKLGMDEMDVIATTAKKRSRPTGKIDCRG